jgi:hypothetical protein
MKHSPAAAAYLNACNREHADCALELVTAFNQNEREAHLSQRVQPLVDIDVICIAEALRTKHSLRILNLEENSFGQIGLQALIEALAANPGVLRELRLGKNKLKDGPAAMLGNALAVSGVGLKVLDLSENGITKIGVTPLCQAIAGRYSELVELSLHNNQLESDCGLPLAQAVRQSSKLRHLHLGYNSLRDAGVIQLARCLPVASSLATLDLTANHIGPQGAQELCKVLLNPSCTLQRLNLRSNDFNDDAILGFAEVVARNTSLTNLFLGFMDPSSAIGLTVVSALRQNRTLLLIDFFGWKLKLRDLQPVLDGVLETNMTLRAIILDAMQPNQMDKVDRLNMERDQRALHPIYVGPDDRHANQAASVRVERGRSFVSSHRQSVQLPQPEQRDEASKSSSVSLPRAVVVPEPQPLPKKTSSVVLIPTPANPGRNSSGGAPAGPSQQRAYSPVAPSPPLNGNNSNADAELDAMLGDLERVNCEPELRNRLLLIISQLQLKMEIQRSYQQQQIVALEERVRVLESQAGRRSNTADNSGFSHSSAAVHGNPSGYVPAVSPRQASMTISTGGRLSPSQQTSARAKSPSTAAALAAAGLRPSPTRELSPAPTSANTVPPLPMSRNFVPASGAAPSRVTQSPDRGRMAHLSAQPPSSSSQPRMIIFSGSNNAPAGSNGARGPSPSHPQQTSAAPQRTTSPSPFPERSGSEPRPATAAMAEPPNPPKSMAEPSPVQPDLQHSQHSRTFTLKLESTPRKQEQVGRKQPPRNA